MTHDNSHLELIAKLLRQAEGTNHEAEANAFFTRAQTLATRHSIDLAIARAHTAKAEKREVVEERTVNIGRSGSTGLSKYVQLYLAIARANDIRCLIARDSSTVYSHGFPSDLDVAEALYASLVFQMVRAGNEYLATGEYKSEKVWVEGHYKKVYTGGTNYWGNRDYDEVYVEGQYKPVHGKVARLNFYVGFTQRISARLWEAKEVEEAKAATEDAERTFEAEVAAAAEGREVANLPISTALVLTEKKAEVDAYYNDVLKKQKIRGSWRGGRSSGQSSTGARRAGAAAGSRASLSNHSAIGA